MGDARDRTERRAAWRRGTRAEEPDSLAASAPVGFLVVQGGKVVYLNPEQERILGTIPVPFDIETLGPLVHRDDREAFLHLFRDDFALREPRRRASLRLRPHGGAAGPGGFSWLQCRAAPVRYRGKDALLVNMIDAGRPRESERPGAVAATGLERLAAAIAHEIRNPLSGVNLNIASLDRLVEKAESIDDDTRRTAREIAGTLRRDSDRIEAVVRRILGISRHRAPQLVPSDANRCAETAGALSSMAMLRNGIHFLMRLAEGLPPVHADPPLLEEAILNLLTNAAEAVQRTDRPRQIELASAEQDGFVVIRVADSGPGVPESVREKIFSPFFTTRRGAVGIGLTFSHRIIADHGGMLTVGTSRLGGAEFRIALPAARGGENLPRGRGR